MKRTTLILFAVAAIWLTAGCKKNEDNVNPQPAYADLEFVLGDWADKQGQLDGAYDHYAKGYAYLARHNEWRFEGRLEFVRQSLLELPPEQRKRQAERLAKFWKGQEDLANRYPYLLTMCQRYAG